MIVTNAQIEAGRSPRGGWTRATLAGWGISWPPPRGWRRALKAGKPIPKSKRKAARRKAVRRSRGGSYWDRQWQAAMERDAR